MIHRSTTEFQRTRLPQARTGGRRAVYWLIWTMPIVAAVVAGVLVFQAQRRIGPAITIEFESASGLEENQSVIRYRGVRVGKVNSIQLTRDLKHVEIRARLERFAAGLAREGSVFWIVRPEMGTAGFHALETIVSGPYIEALPGPETGKTKNYFIGASEEPVVKEPGAGTEFVLIASQVRSLGPDSPVFYRGLQAGRVQYLDLSENSTVVRIHVVIKPSFASLVRSNTVWWNAGGIDVNWHLLSGLNMSAENIRSVITGGIAFATPDGAGPQAVPGMLFALYGRPDEKWLGWAPQMEITNAAVTAHGSSQIGSAGMDLENVNRSSSKQ